MRIRTLLKPLSFLPAIFLMYMIFTFSGQEGDLSSSVSYKASYLIVKSVDYVFETGLQEYQISDYAVRINGITRKLAHMTEYFLLAIAVSFPLYVYGLRGILLVIVAGAICIGYACTDEYHQSFVAGRAASKKDVAIDSFGVLIGILLVRIIGWTGRHTLFKPIPEEATQKMTARQIRKLVKKQKKLEKKQAKEERRYEERYYKERIQEAKDRRYAGDPPYSPPSSLPDEPVPPEPEESPDELSEDMPFSRLFHPGR